MTTLLNLGMQAKFDITDAVDLAMFSGKHVLPNPTLSKLKVYF